MYSVTRPARFSNLPPRGSALYRNPRSADKPACRNHPDPARFPRASGSAVLLASVPGVDHQLLQSWLELPPGAWPPDHYTLLGLPPGPCDPTAVEGLVLARMDRLRGHQLRHPELVTEGMNRLAQALIALTDPGGKAAYDAELGLAPTAATVAPEQDRDAALIVAGPAVEEDAAEERAADRPDRTQVIEVPAFEVEPAEPLLELDEVEEGRQGVVEAVAIQPARSADPESRRWIYARLAVFRRAVRAWDQLRPTVGDAEARLPRAANVLVLLEAVAAIRPFLPQLQGVIGGFGEPGGTVAAVATQPLLLPTFRALLPDQRQALGLDWKKARTELRREYRRLRRLAGGRGTRGRRSRPIRAIVRWLRETPELVIVLVGVVGLALALFRGALGISW